MKKKVLIGSPVHQKPQILNHFLKSLSFLEDDEIEIHYLFIDDNENNESSKLLQEFAKTNQNVMIHPSLLKDQYVCNEHTHHWNESLIWKVAEFKNMMLKIAEEYNYDYIFLVDSDLVLHPQTLNNLINSNKDIISNIFWTKWQPDFPELPQVWLVDHYDQYEKKRGEKITNQEILSRREEFLDMLSKPGIYEVGGLGACTLISKNAIKAGVNFSEIKNISFWGEDRHFCIRAQALGFNLYVDTQYPAYHIYRDEDLEKLEAPQENNNYYYEDDLVEFIKRGVEALGNYHYLEGYVQDWKPFYTTEMVSNLNCHIKSEQTVNELNQLVVRAQVSNVEFSDTEENSVRASFILTNDGFEKGVYFEEASKCEVLLVQVESEWLIDNFTVQSSLESQTNDSTIDLQDSKPRITLSMVIKNEEDRYLRQVLLDCREFIDEAVIIDDGSTDNSVSLCYEILHGIPIKLIRNSVSKFSNEVELRKQQWEATISTNPEWILNLDADEIFENNFKNEIQKLISQSNVYNYAFRLYDMWDPTHFRSDEYWSAHMTYRPFLTKYKPDFLYEWKDTPQHCGRFPENILELPFETSQLRLKHFGWAKVEDRIVKHQRYQELDPNAQYGWQEQYDSILDETPNLIEWNEYTQ